MKVLDSENIFSILFIKTIRCKLTLETSTFYKVFHIEIVYGKKINTKKYLLQNMFLFSRKQNKTILKSSMLIFPQTKFEIMKNLEKFF